MKSQESLARQVWKRMRRNRVGMLGLVVICLSVMVAILGYLIMPDSTPLANDQKPELTIKKPGFSVQMLKVSKNEDVEIVNVFSRMIFGQKSPYRSIPITAYHFDGPEIVVNEYTGNDEDKGLEKRYNLADVVYALSYENPEVKEVGQSLQFTTINGEVKSEPVKELQRRVEDKFLITRTYWLGTDRSGRDLLSRLMGGTRVSLSVGFISVMISLVIGILMGAIAGFFRGRVDDVILWIINVVWSIPTLLLVIAIALALGKGFWQVFVAVGLTMWVEVARVVRGQVLSIREKEYIEAGRALGYQNFRLIIRHVLPNVMGPVIVISAANFASAILIEAGLSFLGVGAPPPTPSWGSMIRDHYGYIIVDAAYLAILPGLAISMMVLAFTLVGNALRDAFDTKGASNQSISSGPGLG
ncbi:MAG: ABC transporter permease [Flavobacteriales bacterium]|nr:ABC transporter permease [Flavobacteriales bacterium]MCB9448429.1 ABC transporter permease [Flavobacteriales bacterium]